MKEHGSTVVNPIYYWNEHDIWDYIHQEKIEVNPLYSKGYSRVGCIGCPMATYKHVCKEFADYPTYKKAYINAFEKMLKTRREKKMDEGKDNLHLWKSGQEVFDWWIEKFQHEVKGQYNLFDEDIYG